MSKAVFLDAIGGPENLHLRAHQPPAPGPGELRVRTGAIGLNFIDIYHRTGLYPVSLPAILGLEAAGLVEAVGADVNDFKPGDRIAFLYANAYAQETNIPAARCVKLPDTISDEIAAAVLVKGLTVQMLVRQIFPLKAGDACLVYAAAGGVGTLLCQWAHHIGAQVIGVVGSEEKAALARTHGADEIIIRTKTDNIAAEVRKHTDGRGVNVVYDSIGAATFETSLNALAMRGHMITYGNASGPAPAIAPLELMRRGSLTLTRPTMLHYATPEHMAGMAAELFALIANGAITPQIRHRFPLAQVSDAHRLLESGESAGAIILTPQ